MSTLLWVVLPVLIALGSSLMAVYIMQQRMEVQLARERQSLAEARASIEAQKTTLEELHRLRGEEVRRQALDTFLAELRTEERHFIREQKMLFASRKSLVLQERIYFRNIPLSNWVEHEVSLEEGADVESLAKTVAVFSPDMLLGAVSGNGSSSERIPRKLRLLK